MSNERLINNGNSQDNKFQLSMPDYMDTVQIVASTAPLSGNLAYIPDSAGPLIQVLDLTCDTVNTITIDGFVSPTKPSRNIPLVGGPHVCSTNETRRYQRTTSGWERIS